MKSVLEQKRLRLEIILVDDGSTDGTADIAKEYADKHENIKLYKSNHKGPGGARNIGVRHAKGEFIAFLDADDLLVPGIYRRMLRAAKNNDAQVCICNAVRFNKKAFWYSDIHSKAYKNYSIITNINDNPNLIYDSCVWNKLIKRDFYRSSGLSFPKNMLYEDIIFNSNLYNCCNKVVMLAETGYLWRARESTENASITQNYYRERNVGDRFIAVKHLIKLKDSENTTDGVKKAIQQKLLEIDLKVILDSVKHSTEEQSKMLFKEVSDFIDEHIDQETIEALPIVEMQRYKLVRDGDVDGFKRLIDYKWNEYDKAPVEEKNGKLYATLPEEIITVEKRELNDEFAELRRRTWIDDARVVDDELEIDAHLYIQRYNMSKPDDQKVTIYLVNEETNQKIEVETIAKETHFLTENYGKVYDPLTGITSHYNYDYTGFTFRVGKNILGKENRYNRTKYSIVAEYEDRMFRGVQIIEGVSEHEKKKYWGLIIEKNDERMYMDFGVQGELQIIVKKA